MWIRERCDSCEGSGAHSVQYFAELWYDDAADFGADALATSAEPEVRVCAECFGDGFVMVEVEARANRAGFDRAGVDGADSDGAGTSGADADGVGANTAGSDDVGAKSARPDHLDGVFAAAGLGPNTSVDALVAAELSRTTSRDIGRGARLSA